MKPGRSLIDQLEHWHNLASDTRMVWVPFQFLQPGPAVRLAWPRLLKMSMLFGIYYGAFACLRRWLVAGVLLPRQVMGIIGWWIVFAFFWFHLVTAPLWNRRARRLAGGPSTEPDA